MNALLRKLAKAAKHGKSIEAEVSRVVAAFDHEQAAHRRKLKKSRPRREANERAALLAAQLHAALMTKVRARDGNRCQLCDEGDRDGDPIDPHHLELGSTKTKRERLSNVLCAHRTCHDAYHACARTFVARVKAWCDSHGYAYHSERSTASDHPQVQPMRR